MPTSPPHELLREARSRAGLTQVQLARLAGVAQSVISAYESGRRRPAFTTLAALVGAAGFSLDVQLREKDDRLTSLTGSIGRRVAERRLTVLAAASEFGVSNLQLFGSVARAQEHSGSDVDLLADFPTNLGLFSRGRLVERLEAILETTVDLVPANDLKPGVRDRVGPDLIPL